MMTIGYITESAARDLGILAALEDGAEHRVTRADMESVLLTERPEGPCWAVDEDGATTYLPASEASE